MQASFQRGVKCLTLSEILRKHCITNRKSRGKMPVREPHGSRFSLTRERDNTREARGLSGRTKIIRLERPNVHFSTFDSQRLEVFTRNIKKWNTIITLRAICIYTTKAKF